MSLNLSGLKQELTDLATNPPKTAAECAEKWAKAMKTYAMAIAPPSTTVETAGLPLQASLVPAFSPPNNQAPPTALGMVETAFLAFATTVGGGMAPNVPTPPVGAVGFASMNGTTYDTVKAGVDAIAGKIDKWMKTGIATPPSAPPIPWT